MHRPRKLKVKEKIKKINRELEREIYIRRDRKMGGVTLTWIKKTCIDRLSKISHPDRKREIKDAGRQAASCAAVVSSH